MSNTLEINRPLPQIEQVWIRNDGTKFLITNVTDTHVYFKNINTGYPSFLSIPDFMAFKTLIVGNESVKHFALFVQQ